MWVAPLPLLPEEVEEGGMYMEDGAPYSATHSVTNQISHVKPGTE